MSKNSDDHASSRNGKHHGLERIDVDPPFPPATANAMEQLRRLLSHLIAKAITADRNKTPAAGDAEKE